MITPLMQEELSMKDRDSEERYDHESLWYPDRKHKVDNHEGPMDFIGDESFYNPSKLGTAEVIPAEVEAGSISNLVIKYRCGERSLKKGDRLRFYMRGQYPLGVEFHGDMEPIPGRYEIRSDCSAILEPCGFGFKIADGELNEGDVVELHVDEPDGFKFTPIAGRYEFKAVFHYSIGGPEQRLGSPVVVEVLPGKAIRLEATRPCTVLPGKESSVHVTVRDSFDNRVAYSGILKAFVGDHEIMIPMVNGLADIPLSAEEATKDVKVCLQEKCLETMASPSVESSGLQLYVGDLHVHDFLSEAHQYTDKVYDWAVEDRNMDFVSVSIQTHGWIDNQKWAIEKYHAERYLKEGKFVTLLANEWQHTAFGDKVIHHLGNDQPFLCVDDSRYNTAAKLYDAVRDTGAVVISHHCSYPLGSWCGRTNFDCVDTSVERLTELWSMHGSSEGFVPGEKPLRRMDPENSVMAALRKGLRLGFVGGSDTHSGRPGGSAKEPMDYWGGQACLWADSLTRKGIMEALYARRTYAITGARIILQMTVNGAAMGSEIPSADCAEINIKAKAPSKIKEIQIVRNTGLLKSFSGEGAEMSISFTDKVPNGNSFYHCRVVLEDGNLAVCSPVWIG